MQSESKLTHCAHHHQTHNNIYTNLDIDMNLTKPNLSLVTYRVSSLYNAIVPAGRPCVSSSMPPLSMRPWYGIVMRFMVLGTFVFFTRS